MNFNDLRQVEGDLLNLGLPFPLNLTGTATSYFINGYKLYPIEYVNPKIDRTSGVIEIYDDNNALIGYFLFSTGKRFSELSSLSEFEMLAMLTELPNFTYFESFSVDYSMRNDYVLIPQHFVSDYENNFKQSSPIWANFIHKEDSLVDSGFRATILRLRASQYNLEDAPLEMVTLAQDSVQQNSGFISYLHLYQLFELYYDVFQFKNIQKTPLTQINTLGKYITEFGKKEIEKLKMILKRILSSVDIPDIEISLNEFSRYSIRCDLIFNHYNKSDNPIDTAIYNQIWAMGGFTYGNIASLGIRGITIAPPNTSKYLEFLISIIAYWMYRLRCSVAHRKFGEYIVESDDEELYFDAGINLIRCVSKKLITNLV